MSNNKSCATLTPHDEDEWQEDVEVPVFESIQRTRTVVEYHWCDGVETPDPILILHQISVHPYRNLTDLKFTLVNREGVPTEFDFNKILPGDSKATISLLNPDAGDDGWAVVDIRILARKPYVAREVEL